MKSSNNKLIKSNLQSQLRLGDYNLYKKREMKKEFSKRKRKKEQKKADKKIKKMKNEGSSSKPPEEMDNSALREAITCCTRRAESNEQTT